MGDVVDNGRWQAPVQCPVSPVLLGSPMTPPPTPRLEDIEAAALLRAFGSGNAALLASQPALDEASDRVVERYHAAHAAIDEISRLVARQKVYEARRAESDVTERHANDGPEDLRRRAVPKWMVWIVLLLAAIFDAAFVGTVVQSIFGVGPDSLLYRLAYLPGVGLALCLLASGHSLAEHMFRHKVRATRARRRKPTNPWQVLRKVFWHWRSEEQTREDRDLPWARLAGPVFFAVLAVGVLAAGAGVRALDSSTSRPAYIPVFMGLLVLLSVSAIAVTVISHNPYADSAAKANRDVSTVEKQAKSLVGAARKELVAHSKAWNYLRSTITTAEGDAVRIVEEECARILEDRGRRGVEGPLRLPLTVLRWPEEGEEPTSESVLPALRLEILQNARDVASRHSPNTLQDAFDRVVAALHQQFRPTIPVGSQ